MTKKELVTAKMAKFNRAQAREDFLARFEGFTVEQCQECIDHLQNIIQNKKDKHLNDIKSKMEAMASASGFTLEELFGSPSKTSKRYPPKYRNPANPFETWSGHGRVPYWFRDLKSRNKTDEALIASK